MADFNMPMLGADMDAGTLLEWRVKPGDRVHRGDVVALVDTEKAAVEIEIFLDGVVEELVVPTGIKVPVGTLLARVRTEGEAPHVAAAPPAEKEEAIEATAPRLRMSPAARRRALELGVDATKIAATGPHGTISLADVEAAAAPPAAEPDRAARLRRAIAGAMARSNREIPHYYLATTIPMGASLGWLEAENARRDVAERILPVALLVKAVALSLVEIPELNGFWRNDAFEAGPGVHVGMVVSLRGGGVVVPAVHDADRLSLDDTMTTLRDLVARARAGSLRSSELSDGTITLTNLGERAPEAVFGVIFPPQVALVGFGGIVERPWVVDGKVVAERVITATLAADHRAGDGHLGARFLQALERRLQEPKQFMVSP
jgi:pyruvate dehydrogenase E2 component (dihydrolipoamide acetyltransferase)